MWLSLPHFSICSVAGGGTLNCSLFCQWLILSLTPLAITVAYRLSPFHPLAKIPGPLLPKATSLWFAYVVYTGKRHVKLAQLHDKYGVFVRTGPNTLSINSHKAVQTIYTTMDKSNAYRPGRFFDGGLFFIRDKHIHAQQRKIWANAFSPTSLSHATITVWRRSSELAAHLANVDNQSIDLADYLRRWSYDIMGDLTFGESNCLELMAKGDKHGVVSSGQKATVLFEILGEIPMIFDVICHLPRIFMREIYVLQDLAISLLSQRRRAQPQESDICSHLLQNHSEGGYELSKNDLENDITFAIQAGSDTTSSVLTLLFYYILADRDVYTKLITELNTNFGCTIDTNELPALFQLPYLQAVVQEALRLGTPLGNLPRVVPPGGCVISSRFIPAGTIVGVPIYAQEISEENFWPAPLEFKPQRWLAGGLGPGSLLNKSAVMCFSHGLFGCLGKTLAIKELFIATAQLLLALDIRLDPSFDHHMFKAGIYNMRTTIFKYPLIVTVRPRDKNQASQ
ncbi:cytochrome P450 [Mycena olivaceomarginata]|nr:cytochrome P450 [Mycena olivaceomarginata]